MQQHSYPQKHKKFENDIFQYLTVGLKDTWGKKKVKRKIQVKTFKQAM